MAEKKDFKKLEEERDEFLNGWKRAKADLANFKREESERLVEFKKFCNEAFISELLIVLDSFELALGSVKDEDSRKGILMIQSQFLEVLKRNGLELINLKIGDDFDEKVAESVGETELENADLSGKISEIISFGYRLNGRVIRAAKVKLGK